MPTTPPVDPTEDQQIESVVEHGLLPFLSSQAKRGPAIRSTALDLYPSVRHDKEITGSYTDQTGTYSFWTCGTCGIRGQDVQGDVGKIVRKFTKLDPDPDFGYTVDPNDDTKDL